MKSEDVGKDWYIVAWSVPFYPVIQATGRCREAVRPFLAELSQVEKHG